MPGKKRELKSLLALEINIGDTLEVPGQPIEEAESEDFGYIGAWRLGDSRLMILGGEMMVFRSSEKMSTRLRVDRPPHISSRSGIPCFYEMIHRLAEANI